MKETTSFYQLESIVGDYQSPTSKAYQLISSLKNSASFGLVDPSFKVRVLSLPSYLGLVGFRGIILFSLCLFFFFCLSLAIWDSLLKAGQTTF